MGRFYFHLGLVRWRRVRPRRPARKPHVGGRATDLAGRVHRLPRRQRQRHRQRLPLRLLRHDGNDVRRRRGRPCGRQPRSRPGEQIATAITSTDEDVRPSMPPLPAPYLTDNQWLTILRWTANPTKGDKPSNNRPPQIAVDGTAVLVDQMLDVHVVVTDPDGDPVRRQAQDWRSGHQDDGPLGAFTERFDTSSWPRGHRDDDRAALRRLVAGFGGRPRDPDQPLAPTRAEGAGRRWPCC